MKPYLFVVRSKDLKQSVKFYSALGLAFEEEQHGAGPVHFSTNLNGLVFELYPCKDGELPSNNRLGFELNNALPNYDDVLAFVKSNSGDVNTIDNSKNFCVLSDPDGRKVEIVFKSDSGRYDDLIARSKSTGYLDYEEFLKWLPEDITDEDQIEDVVQMLDNLGIEVRKKNYGVDR